MSTPGASSPTIPPERVSTWVRSLSDESVRDLDLRLLADLARTESEPARMKKVVEILQANVVEAVGEQDWDAAARTIEAIQHVAQDSGPPGVSLLAAEALQKLGASSASETPPRPGRDQECRSSR